MKRKMMTRFSAGCLALLLTFGSVCSVQAAQEPAEPVSYTHLTLPTSDLV